MFRQPKITTPKPPTAVPASTTATNVAQYQPTGAAILRPTPLTGFNPQTGAPITRTGRPTLISGAR